MVNAHLIPIELQSLCWFLQFIYSEVLILMHLQTSQESSYSTKIQQMSDPCVIQLIPIHQIHGWAQREKAILGFLTSTQRE